MLPHTCDLDPTSPCPCPPHPDVLAALAAQRAAAPASDNAQAALFAPSRLVRLSTPKPSIQGLNDGVIFPPSSFGPDAAPSSIVNAALARPPLRGNIKVAIVLVEFSDQRMASGAVQRFNDLFFSTGVIPTGSVTEYYSQVSGGKISMSGQVVGPYLMPDTLVNYAHGAFGFRDPRTEQPPPPPNTTTMADDALNLAKGDINLDPYDNDGNGFVDAFVVVHAGSGGETTGNLNNIWSVKWTLPQSVKVGNVNVYGFLTLPDDARLGVCCHEVGHLLFGWPDLYDADESSQGLGAWCLMAGGSWGGFPAGDTPCHPSAWCKANQDWVKLTTPAQSRHLTLPDVKDSASGYEVYKLSAANTPATEQPSGFDASLPAGGLLVWHVDEAQLNNKDETHYKVALVQADGLNQLATKTTIRGDPGDPFPGTSNNTAFTVTTNPNSKSYGGLDTGVTITNISVSEGNVTMDIGIPTQTFFPVYNQGEPGHGIGGYDLRSSADLSFPFDYKSAGKLDHIVLYRPGTGTCWILANNGGSFSPVYNQGDPGGGIGGYDLRSAADRGLAFDYNSSGKLDHLVFYRPGKGAIFILKNNQGTFTPVYAQGDDGHFGGIGGYDIRSAADRIFAFDYNSSGKMDHLCCYRPGTGTMWILRQTNGAFTPVYQQGDPGHGIGNYDLKSPNDRAFAFDWDSSGKMDHIVLYRPGTGTFWCLRNNQGVFSPVMSIGDPGNGIGGYDLKSPADVAFAYDWEHSGKKDHIALYRPGTGTFWVLKHVGTGMDFSPVYNRGDPGDGVGGYDLKSSADKIYAFDYEHSGTEDYLVCYRTSGTGTIWILKRG